MQGADLWVGGMPPITKGLRMELNMAESDELENQVDHETWPELDHTMQSFGMDVNRDPQYREMSLIEGYYLDQMGIIDDGLDKISKAVTLREIILKKQKKSQQPQS